jgi:pyruvate/2-oxoglutarate/acetoin dehydrogenase E1 component
VLESVRQTGRALVVHEDTSTAGFAGEIIATIASETFAELKAPPGRLCTLDCPIPYDVGLMAQIVPSVDQIRAKIENLLVD